MREYYRNRYANDPLFREKTKRYQNAYRKTINGKLIEARRNKKFRENNPDYYKDYCKKRREEAKANGMCAQCIKFPARSGGVLCEECRARQNKNNERVRNLRKEIKDK